MVRGEGQGRSIKTDFDGLGAQAQGGEETVPLALVSLP